MSVQNMVLLGSAVVPPIVAGVICWFLWKSAKRHDAWEAEEKRDAWEAEEKRKTGD